MSGGMFRGRVGDTGTALLTLRELLDWGPALIMTRGAGREMYGLGCEL